MEIVKAYMIDHPESNHLEAASIIRLALMKAFPCVKPQRLQR